MALLKRSDTRRRYAHNKAKWKFYQIAEDLFTYSSYSRKPIIKAAPKVLRPYLLYKEPVLKASYQGAGRKKQGSITTYLLKSSREQLTRLAEDKDKKAEIRDIFGIRPVQQSLFQKTEITLDELVDREYNLRIRHTDIGAATANLVNSVRHDVAEFCNYRPAMSTTLNTGVGGVSRIRIKARPDLVVPRPRQLIKEGKGRYDRNCLLDIGVDLSEGCVTTITPGGLFDPESRCGYCYSRFQNGLSFLETVFDFDEKRFISDFLNISRQAGLEEGRIHVRLGQRTECGVPGKIIKKYGLPDSLKKVLGCLALISREREIRGVMPTKMPEYSQEAAELMARARIKPMISIVDQRLEEGVLRHGYSIGKRLDEALKFAQAGLMPVIYIGTDITRGINHMYPDGKKAMEFYMKHQDIMSLQFLDMRIIERSLARRLGGDRWDALRQSNAEWLPAETKKGRLFPEHPARWYLTGQTYLAANVIHPEYKGIVGDNKGKIRICATHPRHDKPMCGACFMDTIDTIYDTIR